MELLSKWKEFIFGVSGTIPPIQNNVFKLELWIELLAKDTMNWELTTLTAF